MTLDDIKTKYGVTQSDAAPEVSKLAAAWDKAFKACQADQQKNGVLKKNSPAVRNLAAVYKKIESATEEFNQLLRKATYANVGGGISVMNMV